MIISGDFESRTIKLGARELDPAPSQKLINHSPDGFMWGYGGSGPAQLALALLLDYTGDPEWSVRHHQAFKWDVIARLPQRSFTLYEGEIQRWLDKAGWRVTA